jgi:serine/threonine-protein kinase
VLGEGGMGRVYKAVRADGQHVALKLVKAELAQDPVYIRRFEREARIAAQIAHRHVVPVLDVGVHEGVPYLTQQFIRGGTLQDKLDREKELDLETAIRMCCEIAAGLEVLHEAGLVHRDLKPANILLDEQGSAHITDFGLAKQRDASVLTQPGQAVGSMDYMSPEQITGQDVTRAADIYGFGCLMYRCIAGEPPFASRQGMQILWAHLQDDPPDPCLNRDDLPGELGWSVLRALAKDPEDRPPSAMAFARMCQVAGAERRTS